MPSLPMHMRRGQDPVSRIAALERQVAAITEWAEQNGWDVATGFIKSDLSKKKPVRPQKEVTDGPANTE